MDEQEKPFRDLQRDERLKRLKRNLKLTQIKRPNSSQVLLSPHMSISGISSIHGDNPLSDFSFCTTSGTSSRTGSVILASSNNLRKKMSKNLKSVPKIGPTTSSIFDQSFNSKKLDDDRVMMPPPPAKKDPKLHSSVITEQKRQAINSPPTTLSQSYENQNHNIHSSHEVPQSECGIAVENESSNEVSRNKNTSRQYGRIFRNWIVRLNDNGQIIIKGRLESGEQARSKAVKRRLSATTLLSVLNHKYRLTGDIHDIREELPEYVRGKFYNGFPTDWENVRQIWQGYIASGCSLQFRWPRPIADSDDDLRSDITDLTVSHLKNARTKPTSYEATSQPCQTAREIDSSSRKRESRSHREKQSQNSDISTIYSTTNEESENTLAKLSILATSCRNTAERTTAAPGNHAATQTESASRNVQHTEMGLSKCGNMVQRWKVDIIVDNLLNKNCSKVYIEKIIRAIDCIDELFTMPATNGVETATDEGVSLNYNSHSQPDTTTSKIYNKMEKAEALKNIDSFMLQHSRQAAPPQSNSFSLDSSEESEEKPQSEHETFVCEQSVLSQKNSSISQISMKSQQSRNSGFETKNFSNSYDASRKRNGSTPVKPTTTKFDIRHRNNKENQVAMPTIPREKIVNKSNQMERHKQKAIFDSTDTDTEARVSNEQTCSPKNASIATASTRRATDSKRQPLTNGKSYNRVAEGASGACYDSDVSIVNTSAAPSMKPRISSIEKVSHNLSKCNQQRETLNSDFSFKSNENTNPSQEISSVPKRDGNVSIQKSLDSSSGQLVEQCIVRLNKVMVDQYNRSSSTPTKTEKTATGCWKNKIDTSHRTNEPPGSDSENLSIRMSSRGRRILPPLHYWDGERVMLKDRELLYSPGTCCPPSFLANTTILRQPLSSPNATAVSDPVSVPAFAKNFESTNRIIRRTGGICSEMSMNHDEKSEDATMSDRRVTRTSLPKNMQTDVKKNRTRTANESSDSSNEDEKIHTVRRRKRRRIN